MPDIAGFAGQVKDNIKENAGAIEKAVIEIYDLRPANDGGGDKPIVLSAVEAEKSKNGVKMGPGGENGTSVMTRLDQRSVKDMLNLARIKTKDGVPGRLGDAVDSMTAITGSLDGGSKALDMRNITRKTYSVLFNPSMMQLSAHGGGIVRKLDYGNALPGGGAGTGITYGQEETVIVLTVPLFFDRCDPQDAFGADKLSSSLVEIGKGLVKAGLTAAGKKEVTVQREVEGFVGLIRNRLTRFVTFYWGDLCYSGMVNNVDVRYTMFNITGQPVRATVNLSIMCLNKHMDGSREVWRDIYRNAFSKSNKAIAKAGEIGNSVQSWTQSFLNL